MSGDDVLIEVTDLRREFRRRVRRGRWRRAARTVTALDGVSFTVAAGEVVGYLGPNGAGKSTTVKILTGILTPTSGRVRVLGLEPARHRTAVARRIGVVFGQRTALWWDLPLADTFAVLGRLYGVPADRHARRLAELTERLDLAGLMEVPVRQLSLGQRVRAELAAALSHDPRAVFLDEPTIGLDVVSRAAVRDLVGDLRRRGAAVMLTTHDLADTERVCDRVVVVDHGRIIHDGPLGALRERLDLERTLIVDLVEPGPPLRVPGVRTVRVSGPRQWLRFRPSVTTAAEVVAAVAAVVPIRDLTVEEPPVEELVLALGSGGRPAGAPPRPTDHGAPPDPTPA